MKLIELLNILDGNGLVITDEDQLETILRGLDFYSDTVPVSLDDEIVRVEIVEP